MISIIICSKQADISKALKENIEETAGVPYELIVIDNSRGKHSIFEAYNQGVAKAKFNLFCFMHEDIVYHTSAWGINVERHLSNQQVGLIGSAGAFYLLDIPSPWFKAKPFVKNQIQSDPSSKKPAKQYSITKDEEVVCLDGFWFCSRKDVFDKIAFDSESFRGFHFYDLDISLQIHQKGYTLVVVSDVLIEHRSGGSFNTAWLDAAFIFYDKWKSILPVTVRPDVKKNFLVGTKAFRDLLIIMKRNGYPNTRRITKIGWNSLGFNLLTAYSLFLLKLPFLRTKS